MNKINIFDSLTVFLTALLIAVAFSFLLSWPIMWLWNNCLIDAVDHVQPITWLQAWGIKFLFSALFKTHISSKD
jgi:hypothetical protein